MNKFLFVFLYWAFLGLNIINAQTFSGFVQTAKGEPIAYANIGIAKRGVGTLTDEKGKYILALHSYFGNDSLRVSCIGYEPFTIKVADFMQKTTTIIVLKEVKYAINEVVVLRSHFKDKILGYTIQSKIIQAGFTNNNLGYEMGVLIKNKTRAKIQSINLNVGTCTYDSVLYRVNVYEQKGKMDFASVLKKPIYIKFSKSMAAKPLSFDISGEDVWVKGNGLVTIEHIKNMGKGQLTFCAVFPGKTYHRKASQGIWETAPIGVGIFVAAKVEQ